ncbi:ATP-dependent helicase, partial [Dermatophilus congolensis]|nr:ATP-dependent helicase [Dermatophilus congolensis]MBO3158841.1 ATP-dependent helicase [Dermatophilus congolensis]MBO3196948.1 ATP-dependent helicase [Dermatophilus congolensis]MBO3208200.1 ATP-dependent helicase [Dermatophilus congolensis]
MKIHYSANDIADALGRHHPTPEQAAVIEHPLESMLIVAGAGSGKTETMASRVVWLVANGLVPAESVLGLTFTRKAAGELAERITRRLTAVRAAGLWIPYNDPNTPNDTTTDNDIVAPTVSTYNAYAGRLVKEHGLRLGVEPDAGLLTEALAWQLADSCVTEYTGPMDAVEASPATVTAAILSLSGQLAEHLRTPHDLDTFLTATISDLDSIELAPKKRSLPTSIRKLRAHCAAQQQLLPILADYVRRKREHSVIDFADQVQLAAQLAINFPAVAATERRRFNIVLLDEFQDTSEAQMRLLEALFARSSEEHPPPIPVVAVGDPHQSIYGWRGASATTLTRFPVLFGTHTQGTTTPAPTLPLSISWRNDQAILAAANTVAAELTQHSTVQVHKLRPRPAAGPGRIYTGRWATAEEEATGTAQWIARHWWDTSQPHPENEPPRSGRTAAVLCRRRAQFPLIIDALRKEGLPVEVVGLGGLLMVPEITDLVALIASATDSSRSDKFMRLLAGPVCRLGVRDLDVLAAWARHRDRLMQETVDDQETPAAETETKNDVPEGIDTRPEPSGLIEAVEDLPERGWKDNHGRELTSTARARLEWLSRALSQVREASSQSLPEMVMTAERVLGLEVELLSRPGATPESARAQLDAFAEVVAGFAAGSATATPHALLSYLEAAADQERGLDMPAPASTGAVNVLTVHASKGLEWDVVAVPGLVEGGFPSYPNPARVSFVGDQWQVQPPKDSAWTSDLGAIPYPLRGDANGLPQMDLRGVDSQGAQDALSDFALAGGIHAMREERRLAYVAYTRAVEALLVSTAVWEGHKSPRVTSRFLSEIAQGSVVEEWVDMPPEGAENPTVIDEQVVWPVSAPVSRSVEMEAVRLAMSAGGVVDGVDDLSIEMDVLVAEWLAGRDGVREQVAVLPDHVTGTDLVRLRVDPEGFAVDLRRPMPRPPAVAARAGSQFHAWVEARYRSQVSLLDCVSEGGVGDQEWAGFEVGDEVGDVQRWKENFLASEWADRQPLEVEFSVETVIDGLPVRGRIDAVFARPGGGFEVVDWKTGRAPSAAQVESRSMQLALYRLAYAQLRGVDVQEVGAAFFYAADGVTLRPAMPS